LAWNRFSGAERKKSTPSTGGKRLMDKGERNKEKGKRIKD